MESPLFDKFQKTRYIMKCGNCGRLLEYVDQIDAARSAGIQRKCMRCKEMNCTSGATIKFKGSLNYFTPTFKDRLTGSIAKGGHYVV